MQRRVRELVGEQAEARDIGRPAPARGFEGLDGDLNDVAGLGAVDMDRPGDGLILSKDSVPRSATVLSFESCPPELSRQVKCTRSPGATVSTGGIERSHPK